MTTTSPLIAIGTFYTFSIYPANELATYCAIENFIHEHAPNFISFLLTPFELTQVWFNLLVKLQITIYIISCLGNSFLCYLCKKVYPKRDKSNQSGWTLHLPYLH